ncbi:MAG: sulfatase-like hydrolase/transferase [Planctomycetes bacterium]|nr:sulfatase-like hydrolase/transferase [Planctomycetota bacterium]
MSDLSQEQTSKPSVSRRALKALGYSFMACFFLAVPYLRFLTDNENRHAYGFRHIHYFQIMAIVASVAVCVAAYYGLLAMIAPRLPRRVSGLARRLALSPLFALVAFNVIRIPLFEFVPEWDLALVPYQRIVVGSMAVLLFVTETGFSGFCRFARGFALLFSPFPVILTAIFLTFGAQGAAYEEPPFSEENPLEGAPTTKFSASIYILMFDGFDYDIAFGSEKSDRVRKNLDELISRSFFFTKARSPANVTQKSIPQFLYQTSAEVEWDEGGECWFTQGGKKSPATEFESLFQRWSGEGTMKVATGWHLNYRKLLEDDIDYTSSIPSYNGSILGFEAMMNTHAFYLTDLAYLPVRSALRLSPNYFWDYRALAIVHLRERALRTVNFAGDDVFGYFHFTIPHAPYVTDRDGVVPRSQFNKSNSGDGYENALDYADTIVGEVISALKSRGRWDNCLLLLTSDHGHVAFDGAAARSLNVPLIIKMPGQTEGKVIDDEFFTVNAAEWIEENSHQ